MRPAARPVCWLLLWLAAQTAATGCKEDPRRPGVSAGEAIPTEMDGGATQVQPHSLRPPDGPLLPPADEALQLDFDAPPIVHRIIVEADLGALDVHFSIDTTNSISAEIRTLRRDLLERIIPEVRDRVEDVAFGVSRFEDFPDAPFGFPGDDRQRADQPFALLTPVTTDVTRVAGAVAELDSPLGLGGDGHESSAEALFQIATGEGYELNRQVIIEPYDGRPATGGGVLGGVGFRDGALPVVLHVTDAPSHTPEDYGAAFPNTHTLEEAAEALRSVRAQVLGIVSRTCSDDGEICDEAVANEVRDELEYVAHETGATVPSDEDSCPHGIGGEAVPAYMGSCPLVFDVGGDGSGLTDSLVDGIVSLVNGIRFERVSAMVTDDPLGFVEQVVPVLIEQPRGVEAPTVADLLPEGAPDGVPDGFTNVRSMSRLAFEVHLRNTRIAPLDFEQYFRVTLRVMGDDLIIDEQTLRVVVPAGEAPTRNTFDAGLAPVDAGGADDDAS